MIQHKLKRIFGIGLLAAALWCITTTAGFAQPPLTPPYPVYMILDGHYYGAWASGPTPALSYDLYSWAIPYTTAMGCVRSNGQMLVYGPGVVLYTTLPDVLFVQSTKFYGVGAGQGAYSVFEVASTSNDLVCSGASARPDLIFRAGFF